MNEMTTTKQSRPALAASDNGVLAIVPRDFEQAFRMAQVVAATSLAPKDMRTPEAIVVAIMHGLEIGLKPMQAIQSIAVINGRPCIWGDAALALVQGSGLAEYVKEWTEGDGDNLVAHCSARRRDGASEVQQSFSVADAKKAGLWGKAGPWSGYPRRMLQMRARAFALRDAFPDVLKGIAVHDEVQDYAPMRDVTPAKPRDLAAELAAQAATYSETVDEDGVVSENSPVIGEDAEPSPNPEPPEPPEPELVTVVTPEGKRGQRPVDKAVTGVAGWIENAVDRDQAIRLMRANPWLREHAQPTWRALLDVWEIEAREIEETAK